jgi:hypothetical protein
MPRRVGDPFEAEADTVVGGLAADQRVPHLRRAVALPVGDPAGEAGRDYPHRKISTNDAPAQLSLDRLDLRGDACVADTVAEVTDNSPGRAVDLVRVLSQKARRRDRSAIPPARSSGAPTPGASTTPSAAAHGATASANPSASPASARAGGQVPPSSSTGSPGSGGVGYGALPGGYYRFTNSTGFSIGVPDGWRIQHAGHYVYITDPSNAGIFLLIDQSDSPKPNPLLDWEQQAANRASTYPDYHLIRLESVYYPQAEKAADWEFTYVKDGILVHILNRNVLANAHHAYALY